MPRSVRRCEAPPCSHGNNGLINTLIRRHQRHKDMDDCHRHGQIPLRTLQGWNQLCDAHFKRRYPSWAFTCVKCSSERSGEQADHICGCRVTKTSPAVSFARHSSNFSSQGHYSHQTPPRWSILIMVSSQQGSCPSTSLMICSWSFFLGQCVVIRNDALWCPDYRIPPRLKGRQFIWQAFFF